MPDSLSEINFNQIVVVLYKMTPQDSPTIQSIIRYVRTLDEVAVAGYRLIIWDNSPDACEGGVRRMQEQLPLLSVQYIHTPENTFLSKIYNLWAAQIDRHSYLTLLDQDTSLPTEYFKELKLAQLRLEPLILPKVICNGRLVSPGGRFLAHGRLLDSVPSGVVRSKNLLAINSGMSIMGEVLHVIKYDERLRFYGTDTYFMKKYEKYFDHAFVLDTSILHSLAEMENQPNEWHVANRKEKYRTFGIIFSESLVEIIFFRVYILFDKFKSRVLDLSNKL
jgi:hypothetical protein